MKLKKNLLLLMFVDTYGMHTGPACSNSLSEQALYHDVCELRELSVRAELLQGEGLDQMQQQQVQKLLEQVKAMDKSFVKVEISMSSKSIEDAIKKVQDEERARKAGRYSLMERIKKNVQDTWLQKEQVLKMQSQLEVEQAELDVEQAEQERLKVHRMLKLIEEKMQIQKIIERQLQQSKEDSQEKPDERKERIRQQVLRRMLQERLGELKQVVPQAKPERQGVERQKKLGRQESTRLIRWKLGGDLRL